jgi:hypothetical protein
MGIFIYEISHLERADYHWRLGCNGTRDDSLYCRPVAQEAVGGLLGKTPFRLPGLHGFGVGVVVFFSSWILPATLVCSCACGPYETDSEGLLFHFKVN